MSLLAETSWILTPRTEHDDARMLHARDGRGDHTRAQELLEAARTTCRDLGTENHAAATAMIAHKASTAR